jgi:probable phosphoglycerate mutase
MKRTPRTTHAPGARLFAEPDRPQGIHVANVDGASRGNPGPASYGLIVRAPDGTTELEIGKYLGRATNNVAEYYALIGALDYAQAHGIERLLVRSDSELLVRQMQGRYKVKSADLRPLYEHARKLARGLAHFAIEHVPRERNSDADELANIALDRTSSHGGQSAAAPILATSAVPSATESRTQRGAQRVRARYLHGALHPAEPMDLADGDIIELQWKKIDRP